MGTFLLIYLQQGVRFTHGWFNDYFFPPLIRCSLRSRLCLCSAKFLYWMGSAYRLHRRTCYTKKEPPRRISEVLKVAATYSPTISRSAVPSAMLSLSAALAPLRSLFAPSARRRRAHRRPPRASDAFFSTKRPPLTHDYIKSMVSLIRCTIVRLFYWSLSLIRCSGFPSRLV